MGEIFLTSDTHFCHDKPFLYEPRGFSSVEEMNEAIVERWNEVVRPDDIVFLLGDVFLNDNEKGLQYLKSLNGQICIVYGNHDTQRRQELFHFISGAPIITLGYAHCFKYHDLSIYLSHYPTITSNYDEKYFSQHMINFHGHTHQQTNWLQLDNPFMYHVGMDSHNCTPIHIKDAITDVRNKWDEIKTYKVS